MSLIKIDVEGYEYPVLKGLTNYFEENRGNLPNLIIEINPTACPQLGYKLIDIKNIMRSYNYEAYTLNEEPCEITKFKNSKEVVDLIFKQ